MPRYEIAVSFEGLKTVELDLTDEEYAGVMKAVNAINDPNVGMSTSNMHLLSITVRNLDEIEKRRQAERMKKYHKLQRNEKLIYDNKLTLTAQKSSNKMSNAFRTAMIEKNKKRFG